MENKQEQVDALIESLTMVRKQLGEELEKIRSGDISVTCPDCGSSFPLLIILPKWAKALEVFDIEGLYP